MIGADTLEMLPTFQCLISMLMLLAQASNHLTSTIFYRAEPSTFYGCWLLKKLLLLLLTKISIVRVKKNTATSCQCCVVVVSSVCCWWSEPQLLKTECQCCTQCRLWWPLRLTLCWIPSLHFLTIMFSCQHQSHALHWRSSSHAFYFKK